MFNRLDAIEEKYNELTKDLSNPEILNDFNKVKELSKEQSDLEETVMAYRKYKQAQNNLEEAKNQNQRTSSKAFNLSKNGESSNNRESSNSFARHVSYSKSWGKCL